MKGERLCADGRGDALGVQGEPLSTDSEGVMPQTLGFVRPLLGFPHHRNCPAAVSRFFLFHVCVGLQPGGGFPP